MISRKATSGGAAAEGFDAYGAGAGEDVEEARACDAGAKDVEERFAEAVAGGTEREAFQALEDAAAIFAGDDAHGEGTNCGKKLTRTARAESDRVRWDRLTAGLSRVDGARLLRFPQTGLSFVESQISLGGSL